MHIRQSLQDGDTINCGEVRSEQVIQGGGRHGAVIGRQRLHHLLCVHIQAVERFAHQRFHHILGHGHGEQFFERCITVGGQDGKQGFQRTRVASGTFAGAT